MNQIKRITLLLIFAFLVASISGCDQLTSFLADFASIDDEPLPDEIVIGVVVPKSGVYVDGPDDPTLTTFLNGYDLARGEINEIAPFAIRFIIEDDKSTGDGAIAAYNKLIHEDKVVAILGPLASTQVQVAFPVAEQNEIVAIAPSSAAQGLGALGDFVFRTNLTVDKIIPHGVRLTHEILGYQRVAKLTTREDVYSQSADASISEILTQLGIEVVASETAALAATDYTEQLTRIKEQNPDAILISAQPIDTPKMLVQAREVGISSNVPIIVPLLGGSEVREAGVAANGAITFTAWNPDASPESMWFVQNYRSAYNVEPDIFSALAYTSVYLLFHAITTADSTESHAIRGVLAQTKDVETLLGSFSFDEVGDAVYDPHVLIVRDGEFEVLE